MKQIWGFGSIIGTPLTKRNMKTLTKTVLSILVTAVIGVFTVIVTSPRKTVVADHDSLQTADKEKRENLFI